MAQARFHQGEGDPGIDRFPPAKAKPFHQHPGHLGDVGIGIRIRGPPPHHHQQGVAEIGSRTDRLANPRPRRLDHLEIDPKLPAVVDLQAGFGRIGVEHRGDVVLGMASGEQHRRHGEHMAHAPLPQGFETIAQDRPGKFQVAVFHGHLGHQGLELLGQLGKFSHRQPVTTAMAADQNTDRTVGPLPQNR